MSPTASLLTALAAGLGATACCFGPMLLSAIGLGAALAANGALLAPLKPLQSALTAVSLGAIALAWWQLYVHPLPRNRENPEYFGLILQRRRRLFWLVAAVTLALFTFPLYADAIRPMRR